MKSLKADGLLSIQVSGIIKFFWASVVYCGKTHFPTERSCPTNSPSFLFPTFALLWTVSSIVLSDGFLFLPFAEHICHCASNLNGIQFVFKSGPEKQWWIFCLSFPSKKIIVRPIFIFWHNRFRDSWLWEFLWLTFHAYLSIGLYWYFRLFFSIRKW